MSKPYTPIAKHLLERLTISCFTGEPLPLYWANIDNDEAFNCKVKPIELIEEDNMHYLLAETEEGTSVKIRVDLIRNLPTPVK